MGMRWTDDFPAGEVCWKGDLTIGVGAAGAFFRTDADVTIGRMIPGTGVAGLPGLCKGAVAAGLFSGCNGAVAGCFAATASASSCAPGLTPEAGDSAIMGLVETGAVGFWLDLMLEYSMVVFGIPTGGSDFCAPGMGTRLTIGCIVRVGCGKGEVEGWIEDGFCGVPQILQNLASAASSFLHLEQRFILCSSRLEIGQSRHPS